MGLLDSIFAQSNYGGQGGGLLDFLRQSQMQQEQYQPSAGFPAQDSQASPIGVGGYQMPRIGDQAQFTPPPQDPGALPPNAQPAQGQLPMMQAPQAPAQPQSLPPALGGIGSALGRIGAPDGLIARLTGNDTRSQAQQNLKAQYEALVPIVGPQKAMLAVMNPEAGKTILAQALEKKNFGFEKVGDTLIRTDPLTGKAELAYGESDTTKGIAGPDGKLIPYPEGLDSAGRKIFANEIARINADAAGGKKTEVQAKSEKFGNQMELAEQNLKGLESQGKSIVGQIASGIPFGNLIQSEAYQKYNQAKNSFLTAVLRDESGAAIGSQEFVRREKEMFPQPGDSEANLRQKAELRRIAIEGMKKSAGPGYKSPEAPKSTSDAPASSPYPEGATATNPQTGQKLTFRGGKWQ